VVVVFIETSPSADGCVELPSWPLDPPVFEAVGCGKSLFTR